MKSLSLLLILLYVLVPMVPSLFAEKVTIGAGDVNGRYPMDFYCFSSLCQTLFCLDELGFSSGTIAGTVRDVHSLPISHVTINCAGRTTTTNYDGSYSLQVNAGIHSVTASHPCCISETQDNVTVVAGQTTVVNFILQPTWDMFGDGFEAHADFALEFAPWTLVDVDQSPTHRIGGYDWPNAEAPMAYIIFNPSATTPPLSVNAHLGSKLAASFAAVNAPNNDWMITPLLNGVGELSFWARSYNDAYGLEKFNVGVSTTGTQPEDFTIISGSTPVSAPTEWTEYNYILSDYADDSVYIAIQCVSSDVYVFMVDDVRVWGLYEATDPVVPALNTALHPNYPNPFNPETTISYSLEHSGNVKIEVYNVKGQLVRTLINEAQNAGKHSAVWNGRDDHNRSVASGIYYYRLTAGSFTSTKKMVLMK